MLILPVFTKTDQKSLPLVCLTLIILNTFIYFIIQAGDGQKYEEAFAFYQSSGLHNIELKAYQTYQLANSIKYSFGGIFQPMDELLGIMIIVGKSG